MRYLLALLTSTLIISAFANDGDDKIKEIEELKEVITNSKSEVIEDIHTIPVEIFNDLQGILQNEYKDSNISQDELVFKIYDKNEAPSRGYSFKGANANYRRFNFAINNGNKWLISYHVTTGRLSYNNILYLERKRKPVVKSYQIARGSHSIESLLAKLDDPDLVEILYPSTGTTSFIIF